MGRTMMMTAVLLAAVAAALSQPANGSMSAHEMRRIEYGKKNAMAGLRSGNDGVIESTMMFVAKLRLKYPSVMVPEHQAAIDRIAVTHPSESMRYKAYIASNICSDPAWFAADEILAAHEPDQFFLSAANRLQQKLFGMNFR